MLIHILIVELEGGSILNHRYSILIHLSGVPSNIAGHRLRYFGCCCCRATSISITMRLFYLLFCCFFAAAMDMFSNSECFRFCTAHCAPRTTHRMKENFFSGSSVNKIHQHLISGCDTRFITAHTATWYIHAILNTCVCFFHLTSLLATSCSICRSLLASLINA